MKWQRFNNIRCVWVWLWRYGSVFCRGMICVSAWIAVTYGCGDVVVEMWLWRYICLDVAVKIWLWRCGCGVVVVDVCLFVEGSMRRCVGEGVVVEVWMRRWTLVGVKKCLLMSFLLEVDPRLKNPHRCTANLQELASWREWLHLGFVLRALHPWGAVCPHRPFLFICTSLDEEQMWRRITLHLPDSRCVQRRKNFALSLYPLGFLNASFRRACMYMHVCLRCKVFLNTFLVI